MKRNNTKTVWRGVFTFSLLLCFIGCESVTSDLIEIDENGEEHNNSEINIRNSLVSIGVKGYAIDSLYTEFGFSEGKVIRITSLKKGTISYQNNGPVNDIVWAKFQPEIRYSQGIIYNNDSIRSEIEFNNNNFAEEIINTYSDGRIHSIVRYRYIKSTGYLDYVKLERPGEEKMTIDFKYPKADGSNEFGDAPNTSGGVIIFEDGNSYKINFAKQKLENKGYVCNVLRHANAPLTNKYVINPDLYYMGIYGVPIKYLPNEMVQNGVITEGGKKELVIERVGNWRFLYNNSILK